MSEVVSITELELAMRKLAHTVKLDTIEACAKIAREMREKHGNPVGDAYSNGVWDQGVRIEQAITALTSQGRSQP